MSAGKKSFEELQATFDVMWAADQRAIKLWQAAHPGNDLVWPDRTDMVVWLLDELADKERRINIAVVRTIEYEAKCDETLARLNPILDKIEAHNK